MNETVRYRKRKDKANLGAARLNNLIKEMEWDNDYSITIKDWEEEKTWPQIKFFHGPILDAYMEYTGYSWDDSKYTLKKRYGVNKVVKDTQTGKQEVEIRSLADYSKPEMQTFFDRLLNHFEYDCEMIIDSETRKQFMVNQETGEMEEI